ncbi:MAG: hypothetical protein KDK70_02880 [Myxococcales bacterium]|nr:hypothetical protein [Myxococcales bacterium]
MPTARRYAWALAWALALVPALGMPACTKDQPPAPATEPAEPAEPAEAKATATCRDWSTLDQGGLPPLTEGKHAALLDQVWWRVLEKHYDPTLGCLPWGALREDYARKVAEARTDAQAHALINAMLGELGQSHLRLFPPTPAEDTPGPAAPDLTVRWVEDQLVVVRSQADGPQGPVLPGAVLHAINDQPVEALVDEVRARTAAHEFDREIARAVAARLSCEQEGQVKKLKVTNPAKDGRMAVRVVSCVIPPGERVTLGNLRDIPTRVEHRMLEGKVGLLAFNVWMLPMVKQVQVAMESLRAEGMRALVLDLRGNPGGVGAMVVPVARLMLPEEGSLGTMRFRDFEQELNVEHVEGAFTGPVAVLVDEGTASTSEIFAVGMRDRGRIKVVGARPSAGAALPSVIEELQGGALLQYVVADYRSPNGTVVEGKGIEPDVVVTETRADFEAGRDPVLAAAQALLLEAAGSEPAGSEVAGSEPAGSEPAGSEPAEPQPSSGDSDDAAPSPTPTPTPTPIPTKDEPPG